MGGLGGGFDKLKKLTKGSDEDCKVIWEEHQQPHCSTEYEKVSQVPRRLIAEFIGQKLLFLLKVGWAMSVWKFYQELSVSNLT